MNLIYPSKNEIMDFFRNRSGYISVIDISTALVTPKVQRSTPLDEEWNHVKVFLHELKSGGFLLIQNEGEDIYHEKFSSTPDRVDKYFSKDKVQDYSDLTKRTEEELEEIIRRNDNPGVATSLHNRALVELDLRYKKRLRDSTSTNSKNDDSLIHEVIKKIIEIQNQVDKIIDLDTKNLLERKELSDFKDNVEKDIKQFIDNTDDESQRHFKRITSGWKNMSKPGFTNPGEAERSLKDIIDFLSQTVTRLTGKDFKNDVYVPAGRTFDGRTHLQNVLNTAKQEIFIVDNYLQRNILSLLATVVEDKTSFSIKFLIGSKNKNKFDGLIADLAEFGKQYPLVKIECKLHDDLHDRYIIVDNNQLYTVGSSLDSIGQKGNFINKIDDMKSKGDHMADMQSLWSTASDIVIT